MTPKMVHCSGTSVVLGRAYRGTLNPGGVLDLERSRVAFLCFGLVFSCGLWALQVTLKVQVPDNHILS